MGEDYQIIKDSFKDIIQDALEIGIDGNLEYEKYHKSDFSNSRNGYSTKIAKGQNISELKRKVIALYTMGISNRDIVVFIKDIYRFDMIPVILVKLLSSIF